MKKILSTLFIITITIQFIGAQNLGKADRLFEKRNYSSASKIYLENENKTQQVLEKLGDCYYFTTDMRNATTWYKVLMDTHYSKNTVDPIYIFKYAQALKGSNNILEADKWFNIYNDIAKLVPSGNLNTIEYFKALNTTIERPFIIHQMNVNTEGSEFGVSVQGEKAIFASTRKKGGEYVWNNQPYLDLYEATIDSDGEFIDIEEISGNVNTKMHESNGVITKDGKTLYFSRNHYTSNKKVKDRDKVTHLNLYKASLVNGDWTNVIELPFNNPNYSMMHPALNNDETRLYFSSDMPGSIGSFDIFYVDINQNGTYNTPKNLGKKINTPQREQFPFVSSKHTLYFASDGHFGMGGLDVFSSEKVNGIYENVINLSDIVNSGKDDFAFVINESNEIGYFSSNRNGGMGDDDIYRTTRVKQYFVDGIVQQKETLYKLPGTAVTLTSSDGTLLNTVTVGDDATFSMEIKPNSTYTIKGTLQSFTPSEITFTTDSDGNTNKDIFLSLESYEQAEEKIVSDHGKLKIKINPIFFSFDSWDITPEAAIELNEVVKIMTKYPEMIIEIGTHTDSRGDDDYNLTLSDKRANSVRAYLVDNHIPTESVTSKGYGETQILNRCTNDVICRDKEHYENRRCEFVIQN